MKLIAKTIVLILLAVGLVGCAAPKMNLSVPIDKVIVAKEDSALIYFIRPKQLGFAIHAAVYDGKEFIGFVPYNQKLPYFAEPGEHLFMVVSEAADFMKANLLPGKTYYAEVVPRMGAWRARFSLSPFSKDQLNTDEVKLWIAEARLIDNNQRAYDWANDNHESVLHKKTVYLKKWLSKDEAKRPFLKETDSE